MKSRSPKFRMKDVDTKRGQKTSFGDRIILAGVWLIR
jgi:hypothetical protein